MPQRNIRVILIVVLLCLLCSQLVSRTERTLRYILAQVRKHSIERLSDTELFEGAVQGVMSLLDENSVYVNQEEKDGFKEMIAHEFGGVGVEIGQDRSNGFLVVISPIHGSPAQTAGVRPGDRILEIDGVSTQGMPFETAAKMMRGLPGMPVTLTIRPCDGEEEYKLPIVRDVIHGDSVRGLRRLRDGSWDFLLQEDPRIAYAWIESFTDRTAKEMAAMLQQIARADCRGLILDLRNNPGGILAEAFDLCDLFLSGGDIVMTRDRDGFVRQRLTATPRALAPTLPLVLLIDDQTASAAEIVAACLQDHQRAIVIGERSFGKGTVQELIELQPDLGIVKLTTATFWRPSGRNIQRTADGNGDWGVMPDKGFEYDLDDEYRIAIESLRYYRATRPADVVLPLVEASDSASNEASAPSSVEDVELARAIRYLQENILNDTARAPATTSLAPGNGP